MHAHPLPLPEVIERADLGDILRTPTGKLSGGQAQRVRFAMAIMPDPRLIILDEPTVGMDVGLRRRFWEQMSDLVDGGRTVLFATHYLDEADETLRHLINGFHVTDIEVNAPKLEDAFVAITNGADR